MPAEPFVFKKVVYLVEVTGRKARTLDEMMRAIATVPTDSIGYHMHREFLAFKFAPIEYPNDFALWATKSLGDEVLGEKLASLRVFTHRSLEALRLELTPQDYDIFVRWNETNAREIDLYGDFVVIHDPQPAAMPFLGSRPRRTSDAQRPIVWRCHIDASHPHRGVWSFLEKWVRRYDATLFSAPQFAQQLPIPRFLVAPAIDPLSDKNRELPRERIEAVFEKHGIDIKRPTLLQVSRFDRWKDPLGVIRTYKMVKETNDCQLVLAGGGASDDPEGAAVLAEVQEAAGNDPDLHVLLLPPDAHLEINALQRGATIILQKSVREGFGLTVSEGLWKGKPVIGGATGGIPLQVLDGVTGYLVSSPEGAAFRARFLLNHPEIAAEMGRRGVEMVRQNFLVTRNVRDSLVLFLSLMTGERHLAL